MMALSFQRTLESAMRDCGPFSVGSSAKKKNVDEEVVKKVISVPSGGFNDGTKLLEGS